jgi:hypothetical protein
MKRNDETDFGNLVCIYIWMLILGLGGIYIWMLTLGLVDIYIWMLTLGLGGIYIWMLTLGLVGIWLHLAVDLSLALLVAAHPASLLELPRVHRSFHSSFHVFYSLETWLFIAGRHLSLSLLA